MAECYAKSPAMNAVLEDIFHSALERNKLSALLEVFFDEYPAPYRNDVFMIAAGASKCLFQRVALSQKIRTTTNEFPSIKRGGFHKGLREGRGVCI